MRTEYRALETGCQNIWQGGCHTRREAVEYGEDPGLVNCSSLREDHLPDGCVVARLEAVEVHAAGENRCIE